MACVALAGCDGLKTDDVSSDAAAGSDGAPATVLDAAHDAPVWDVVDAADGGASALSPGERAECAALPATPDTYSDEQSIQPLIVGRWIRCDGSAPTFQNESVGVEFTTDKLLALATAPDGGVVEIAAIDPGGIDPIDSWWFGLLDGGSASFLSLSAKNGTTIVDPPVFYDGGKKMVLGITSRATYVRLGL